MQKTPSERRGAERYELKEALDLKIVFSSENPNLLGKTLCGSTLDVSASGLRIELNQKIKIDSVLDVWVTLKDSSKKYFLTGNVRWCNEMEVGGHYQIGVVLRERSDTMTDLEAWRRAFKVKQQ
ncbi:MAG TPA: PilZ domain-containing protein [Gammaproteobacteria bacterium]